MSTPVELLVSYGLTEEQIAEFKKYSAAQEQAGLSQEKHDELTRHLDRILNARTGMNKFSTDPVNKAGFLVPTQRQEVKKKRNGLVSSKSMDCLLSPGKENGKRGSSDSSSSCGLKRARSSDVLGLFDPRSPHGNAPHSPATASSPRRFQLQQQQPKAAQRSQQRLADDDDEERDVYLPRNLHEKPMTPRREQPQQAAYARGQPAPAQVSLLGVSAARKFNTPIEQPSEQKEAAFTPAPPVSKPVPTLGAGLKNLPATTGRTNFHRVPARVPPPFMKVVTPEQMEISLPSPATRVDTPETREIACKSVSPARRKVPQDDRPSEASSPRSQHQTSPAHIPAPVSPRYQQTRQGEYSPVQQLYSQLEQQGAQRQRRLPPQSPPEYHQQRREASTARQQQPEHDLGHSYSETVEEFKRVQVGVQPLATLTGRQIQSPRVSYDTTQDEEMQPPQVRRLSQSKLVESPSPQRQAISHFLPQVATHYQKPAPVAPRPQSMSQSELAPQQQQPRHCAESPVREHLPAPTLPQQPSRQLYPRVKPSYEQECSHAHQELSYQPPISQRSYYEPVREDEPMELEDPYEKGEYNAEDQYGAEYGQEESVREEEPTPYSIKDLEHELVIPSAGTSVQAQPSPSLLEDKYGSFYDLKASKEASSSQQQTPSSPQIDCFDGIESECGSVVQSEPILRYQAPLSAHTELSTYPTFDPDELDLLGFDHEEEIHMTTPKPSGRPDFSNVIQTRFTSKHGLNESTSQLTMVGSTSSVALSDFRASQLDALFFDETNRVDASPSNDWLQQYPVLSPAYSLIMKQQQQASSNTVLSPPLSRTSGSSKSDHPELTSLDDPQTCALLAGIREEITAQDKTLYLAYRNAMRHKHSALPLSFLELKAKIEEFGLDIVFREEKGTKDVKQLFLLPLNGMTVPRWVPPGTSFRIGRSSNWLLAQTRVISRNHCEIFHDIHSYYLKDLGSRSGTFVNGTRIGESETLGLPREIKHGDILQIGVDFGTERDPFGNLPDKYKSGQCIALYGYRARTAPQLEEASKEMKPTPRALESASSSKKSSLGSPILIASVSDSKFERMSRKALAMKSRLASANSRLYIEFGDYISDTSAGTAILLRPDREPSYSFLFNNYKLTWDIGLTCRTTGKHYGLTGDGQVYKIYEGYGMEKQIATLTVQGEHKCLLEPVYERTVLDDEQAIAERDMMSRMLRAQQCSQEIQTPIAISSASPYLLAGSQQQRPAAPSFLTAIPSATNYASPTLASPVPSTDASPAPRNPFFTLTGDLSTPSASFSSASCLAFYVQRFANSRRQQFLGEGQVSAKKSAWGKKTIFYEARLPPVEAHDQLLALMTLFNVLNQLEKN